MHFLERRSKVMFMKIFGSPFRNDLNFRTQIYFFKTPN